MNELIIENLLLDDKQVEMLAFAISSQDIKQYNQMLIKYQQLNQIYQENQKEYIHWLIQEFVTQAYEKYGEKITEKLKEKISILNKMLNIQIDISSMLKTK